MSSKPSQLPDVPDGVLIGNSAGHDDFADIDNPEEKLKNPQKLDDIIPDIEERLIDMKRLCHKMEDQEMDIEVFGVFIRMFTELVDLLGLKIDLPILRTGGIDLTVAYMQQRYPVFKEEYDRVSGDIDAAGSAFSFLLNKHGYIENIVSFLAEISNIFDNPDVFRDKLASGELKSKIRI